MSVSVITFCLLYSERLTQVHLEMAIKIECTVYFKVNTNAKEKNKERNEGMSDGSLWQFHII